jgi:hypothetical protein
MSGSLLGTGISVSVNKVPLSWSFHSTGRRKTNRMSDEETTTGSKI